MAQSKPAPGLRSAHGVGKLPPVLQRLKLNRSVLFATLPIQHKARGRDAERRSGHGVRQPVNIFVDAKISRPGGDPVADDSADPPLFVITRSPHDSSTGKTPPPLHPLNLIPPPP